MSRARDEKKDKQCIRQVNQQLHEVIESSVGSKREILDQVQESPDGSIVNRLNAGIEVLNEVLRQGKAASPVQICIVVDSMEPHP